MHSLLHSALFGICVASLYWGTAKAARNWPNALAFFQVGVPTLKESGIRAAAWFAVHAVFHAIFG